MKAKNGISFIIPCYNAEDTLQDALDSILATNLPHFEICVVNDASTDRSQVVIDRYKRKYPNLITSATHIKNLGGGQTRNDCVKLSKYDWIFCLDADNILDSKSFSRLLVYTEGENVLCFQNIYTFFSRYHMRFYTKVTEYFQEYMEYGDILKEPNSPVADGNILYRKTAFESIHGYSSDMGALDAFDFGFRLLKNGNKIRIVPHTKYYHRISLNSYWFRDADKNMARLKKYIEDNVSESGGKATLFTPDTSFSKCRYIFPFSIIMPLYYKLQL